MAELLGVVRVPDAILYLRHTLPHPEIPADREEEFSRVLGRLTGSGCAFVRAQAYNGLGWLAAENPELRGAAARNPVS